jgi:hypothetical protein
MWMIIDLGVEVNAGATPSGLGPAGGAGVRALMCTTTRDEDERPNRVLCLSFILISLRTGLLFPFSL